MWCKLNKLDIVKGKEKLRNRELILDCANEFYKLNNKISNTSGAACAAALCRALCRTLCRHRAIYIASNGDKL